MTGSLALACAWLLGAVWFIGRVLAQGRGLRMLEPTVYVPRGEAPTVAVVVPARDEEANIAACLSGFRRQSYPAARIEIVAVDDQSSDTTAAIVADVAGEDRRVRLASSPRLPSGWIGKSHACWHGVQQVAADAEWLCFTDADTRAGPDLLATAMAEVERRGLDFLSLLPRQEFRGLPERLVMPCGLYMLSVRRAPAQIQAGRSEAVIATGQFILVRRAAYDRAGGHAAVRGDIVEDVALASAVAACGYRVALASGDQLYSVRMYEGWASLWIGVTKNLVEMLEGCGATLLTGAAAVLLALVTIACPAVTAARCVAGGGGECLAFGLASAGSLLMAGFHLGGAALFDIPLAYGLLFPAGYLLVAALAVDSVRRRLTRRTRWRGRTYPHLTPHPSRATVLGAGDLIRAHGGRHEPTIGGDQSPAA